MKLKALFFLLPLSLYADPVNFTFRDNSDNEDGFIVEGRLPSGDWEEILILLANVTEFQTEADTHEAWRARAFNAFGVSGTTNEVVKRLPSDPSDLKAKPLRRLLSRLFNRNKKHS